MLRQVKSCWDSSSQVGTGQVKLGQAKSSQDWSSPVKTCQINLYQDKLSQDRSNQVMTGIFVGTKTVFDPTLFWT